MLKMKTQSSGRVQYTVSFNPDPRDYASSVMLCCARHGLKDYREERENGDERDEPKGAFPAAGLDGLKIRLLTYKREGPNKENYWPDIDGRYWWHLALEDGRISEDYYWMQDEVRSKADSDRYWFTVHHAPSDTKIEGFSIRPDREAGYPARGRKYWFYGQYDECGPIKQWMEEKDRNYLRRIKEENLSLYRQIINTNLNHPAVKVVQQDPVAAPLLPFAIHPQAAIAGYPGAAPVVLPSTSTAHPGVAPIVTLLQNITISPENLPTQPVFKTNETEPNHAVNGHMPENESHPVKASIIGREGEKIVYNFLLDKYKGKEKSEGKETETGFECRYFKTNSKTGQEKNIQINAKVEWHNKVFPENVDSGTNHDIKIIKNKGQHPNKEHYIEVKATKKPDKKSFYLTTNEYALMKNAGDIYKYSIYRVFNVTSATNPPRIEKIKKDELQEMGRQFRYNK